MPELPGSRASRNVGSVPRVGGASPAEFGAGIARSVQQLGGAVRQHADVVVRQKAEENRDWTVHTLAEMRDTWTTRRAGLQETSQLDDPDVTPSELAAFDENAAELISNAPSEDSARYLDQQLAEYRGNLSAQYLSDDAGRRVNRRINTVNETINFGRNTLLNDPGQFESIKGESLAMLESLPLPGKAKEQLALATVRGLARSAVTGSLREDRTGTREDLLDGVWDEFLDADDKARFLQQADAGSAKDMRGWNSDRADYLAARTAGVKEERDPRFSPEAIRMTMGPGDATERVVEDTMSQEDFADSYVQVRNASPAELAELIQIESGDTLGDTRGFRREEAQVIALSKAIASRNKQLMADPAAFVAQSPSVSEEFAAMLEATPSEATRRTRDYADAALAEQTRLGVPQAQQRLLPEQFAISIGAQFGRQEEGGSQPADTMMVLADQWGSNWGQVRRELIVGDQFTGALVPLSKMTGVDQRIAAGKMAEAMNTGEKALLDAMPAVSKSEMEVSVSDSLADYKVSLQTQLGGLAEYSDMAEGTRLLAYQYMFEGDNMAAAVRKASQVVINDQYDFSNTYRVPKGVEGDVTHGADLTLENIGNLPISIPFSLTGVDEDIVRDRYTDAVQSKGYWQTSSADSGLVLYDETQAVVELEDGTPVFIPWDELGNISETWKMDKLQEVMGLGTGAGGPS